MLSEDQRKFYWRLWSLLKKAHPGVDRHATHLQLGLPESHTEWNQREHFDAWKNHCLAASAANLPEDQEANRKHVFIGHLLAALERGPDHAETIVATMNRGGSFGGRMRTLDSLTGAQLKKVMIALKLQCRRRWPTKEALLWELADVRVEGGFDEHAVRETVMKALSTRSLAVLADMVYEDLLVLLSVLRRIAPPAEPGGTGAPIDIPF